METPWYIDKEEVCKACKNKGEQECWDCEKLD